MNRHCAADRMHYEHEPAFRYSSGHVTPTIAVWVLGQMDSLPSRQRDNAVPHADERRPRRRSTRRADVRAHCAWQRHPLRGGVVRRAWLVVTMICCSRGDASDGAGGQFRHSLTGGARCCSSRSHSASEPGVVNRLSWRLHRRRDDAGRLAFARPSRLGRDVRHAPHVDADCREDSTRARTGGEPLVARLPACTPPREGSPPRRSRTLRTRLRWISTSSTIDSTFAPAMV